MFNWDSGRVVTKIVWGEGRFSFPAPAVVALRRRTTLTTTVNRFGRRPGARRTTASGTHACSTARPAVLVSRRARASGSPPATDGKEAEATTDANGAAAVRLVQPSPKPGKTRVAVEVVKPPENGVGPGTVVGRRETVVEWAGAEDAAERDRAASGRRAPARSRSRCRSTTTARSMPAKPGCG